MGRIQTHQHPATFFTVVCSLWLTAVFALHAQPYGLTSRPSFDAFHGGVLPPTAPTFTGSWSAVPAFPNVTFINALGICELPGQPSNARRMVVWEREGRVYSIPKNSAAANADKVLMLDISAQCQGWDDSGLLALAFHPNFGSGPTNNRYVFIYYTYVTPGTVTGSPTARPNTFKPCRDRLVRYTVDANGVIEPASETIFIDQVGASVWHNGGGMFFHPDDGFLYLTNGDDAQATLNSQRMDRGLFGGVLRIDVDQRGGTISKPISRQPLPSGSVTQNYYIPLDNPFVGQPNTLEEFFAIGLRSPHRMTVDPVSKRIFIGDVGLANWEEVSVIEPGDEAIVCVNGVSFFLGVQQPSADDVARHAAYVAGLVGVEHTGIGLDISFSQPGLDDTPPGDYDPTYWWPKSAGYDRALVRSAYPPVESWRDLPAALQRTGMTADEATLVMGGNMMRVAKQVWRCMGSGLALQHPER